jgi:hypothetical protein
MMMSLIVPNGPIIIEYVLGHMLLLGYATGVEFTEWLEWRAYRCHLHPAS